MIPLFLRLEGTVNFLMTIGFDSGRRKSLEIFLPFISVALGREFELNRKETPPCGFQIDTLKKSSIRILVFRPGNIYDILEISSWRE